MLVRDRLDAEGAEPAVELVRIARAAEKAADLALAADCWGKLAAFVHPKPRAVEVDPEAFLDLERRLVRIKLEETSRAVKDNPMLVGLAERLLRAADRAEDVSFVAPAPASAPVQCDPPAESEQDREPAPRRVQRPDPDAGNAAIIAATPAAVYRPIAPHWPEDQGTVETEYNPLDLQGKA